VSAAREDEQMATKTSRRWADVHAGDALDAVTFPLGMRNMIIDAAGTRDLNPIHHDREFAQRNNARDIFVNTMFYDALFGRIVTDWAGPDAMLRRLKFTMRAPNYVGDTITSRGWVTRTYEQDGERLVDVEVHLDNQGVQSATVAEMTVELA
jgi:acyl dehydratase